MNLDCPELIADYHKRIKANEIIESNKQSTTTNTTVEQNESTKKVKNANDYGYGRGLEIEKILGATDVYGELMFL